MELRRCIQQSHGQTSASADKAARQEARKERNRISAQASRDRKKSERSGMEDRLAEAEQRVAELTAENAQLRAEALQSQQAQADRTAEMENQLRAFEDRFKLLEGLLNIQSAGNLTPQPQPPTSILSPPTVSTTTATSSQQLPLTHLQLPSTALTGSETHATVESGESSTRAYSGYDTVTAQSAEAHNDLGLGFLSFDFNADMLNYQTSNADEVFHPSTYSLTSTYPADFADQTSIPEGQWSTAEAHLDNQEALEALLANLASSNCDAQSGQDAMLDAFTEQVHQQQEPFSTDLFGDFDFQAILSSHVPAPSPAMWNNGNALGLDLGIAA
ncbi:hypothetical protein EMMF5_000900 [Cystobasidiomycetes sp. EMM_F5]